MSNVLDVITGILGLCFGGYFILIIGTGFRQIVFQKDLDKGNMFLQFLYSFIVGIVIVFILHNAFKQIGCRENDLPLEYQNARR